MQTHSVTPFLLQIVDVPTEARPRKYMVNFFNHNKHAFVQ